MLKMPGLAVCCTVDCNFIVL